jgi:hypothetical protein
LRVLDFIVSGQTVKPDPLCDFDGIVAGSSGYLQAFRALHSNKPTTTVLNDAGAWMAVEYAADPKLYIDRKIAELVAANNN